MKKDLDILAMTDEEFEKLSGPPELDTSEETASAGDPEEEELVDEEASEGDENSSERDPQENTQTDSGDSDEESGEEDPPASDTDEDSEGDSASGSRNVFKGEGEDPAEQNPKGSEEEEESDTTAQPDKEGKDKDKSSEKENSEDPKYKAFYERVMAPFKANGKLIKLESAEEVIQLMQMGANYTKKMQALQSSKKFLMMLEANGLLNEEKLSFLIDLDKRDPEAIKKLLKDASIDPLELDISEVNYKGGNHTVSDQEAALATALDDLQSRPGGKETIQSVNGWDPASKKALWENPDLLNIIHEHRENGIYELITTEMERLKMVGQIAPTAPFLAAYKSVGDALAAKGAFQHLAQPAPNSAQQPVAGRTPVAKRPAKTPATKAPDKRVRAAAPPRSVNRSVKEITNFLAMSDEEFEKLASKV